jgi:hypothetical protein
VMGGDVKMDAAAKVEWVLCGGGFRGDGKE